MEESLASQALPAEFDWQSLEFLLLLHQGIVNAYLLTGWEDFIDYLLLLFGIVRKCHLIHDADKTRIENSDCLTDGINVPYGRFLHYNSFE